MSRPTNPTPPRLQLFRASPPHSPVAVADQSTTENSVARPSWAWFVAIALVATLAGLIALRFDQRLAHPDNMQELPGDLKRFVSLSEIFAHGFGVGIIAIGIWLLARDKRRFIPRIVMAAIWPAIGVHFIKLGFARYRPIRYLDELSNANFPTNITDTWLGWMPRGDLNTIYAAQSFPSAHAATTWGLAIGLSWVFPRGKWLFVGIAVLASIQRVTSFAHWPSDVLFGVAIAFVMTGALMQRWGIGKWLNSFEVQRERSKDARSSVDEPKNSRTNFPSKAA